jgi:O-acetyl-ADP-ribose deacetylase (regulator of RNase III)
MAVFFTRGDLFLSGAHTIAHGVNCRGKMGAGIAREFKRRFPQMFKEYRRRCYSGELRPGGYFLDKTTEPWVLNLATQNTTQGATLEYMRSSLENFASYYSREGIRSLAMPKIATGLGALGWNDVRNLMEEVLNPLPLAVYVYEEYIEGVEGQEPRL